MNRYRFYANHDDWRSVVWPPVGPCWCSGYGDDFSVVVAYANSEAEILKQWPEAKQIELTHQGEPILFTDRFARPDWWQDAPPKNKELPTIALSIRQPWAWLIVNGFKDVENRSWRTNFRGDVLIHASKGMTRDEYDSCLTDCIAIARRYPEYAGCIPPAFDELERGGVVGVATITDCIERSESAWFFGKYGFAMSNARPLPFRPCRGALSFFDINRVPEPSKVNIGKMRGGR